MTSPQDPSCTTDDDGLFGNFKESSSPSGHQTVVTGTEDPTMDFLAREQALLGDDAALFGNTLSPSLPAPPPSIVSSVCLSLSIHSLSTSMYSLRQGAQVHSGSPAVAPLGTTVKASSPQQQSHPQTPQQESGALKYV